ncbi:MAG: D-alanine--D-alanine ligase [Epsilonproteobacteria bacterium]|nr:D-alanine--D-alanine ligase [Campylobacterota bacterium]
MRLAVLFGGSSFEHEISIVSAITMQKVFKKTELINIFVSENREFYLIDKKDMKSKYFSSSDYKKAKKLQLQKGGFVSSGMFGDKKVEFDTLLNLIHGRDGEDGKIASLMEFYGVPYISPRLEACAISYNKLFTKLFADSIDVKTVPYELLHKGDSRDIKTHLPVIVKPSRLGSSIGVSIVKEESELDYALDVAFEFDDLVLIEPFMSGIKEYNQAGCYTDKWELSIIEEPHKEEFLDFEKKYMDFSRDGKVGAADIDNIAAQKIQDSFKRVYGNIFKGSIIRCDFFEQNGDIYLNEINPIPGSMANYLFEDFEDMVARLSKNLYFEQNIKIDYAYIHSIQSAKGKA